MVAEEYNLKNSMIFLEKKRNKFQGKTKHTSYLS